LNAWTITDEINQARFWEELRKERKDSKQENEFTKETEKKDTVKANGKDLSAVVDDHFFPKEKTTDPKKETTDLDAEKAWYMFLNGGRWEKYRGAVLIQYDVRCFSNVQMETGTFKFSAHVRILFYDGDAKHGGKDLPDSSIYYNKYAEFYPKFKTKTQDQDAQTQGLSKAEDTCIPPFIKTRNATGKEGDNAFYSAWRNKPRKFDKKNKIWEMSFLLTDVECCGSFEPDDFPYDAQACSIITALILTDQNKCYISRENGDRIAANKKTIEHFLLPLPGQTRLNSRMSDYDLLPTVIAAYNLRRVKKGTNGLHNSRPLSVVRLCVLRKHRWYTINYIAVLFFLSTLSFMVFLIEDFDERLSFNATILLTITAYKYNATSVLPRLSRLTYLDWYIVASFGIVFAIMLLTFIARFISEDSEYEFEFSHSERYTYLALFIVWILFHIYWIIKIYYNFKYLFQKRRPQLTLSIPAKVFSDGKIRLGDREKFKSPDCAPNT